MTASESLETNDAKKISDHSFQEITSIVLPDYFLKLKDSIKMPYSAKTFSGYGSAARKLMNQLEKENDFSGCYVFLEKAEELKPFYVGISRSVIRRIVQHVNAKSHFSASLAYRMAFAAMPHKMTRSQAMDDKAFNAAFLTAQQRIKAMQIAFVEIDHPVELYLFDVYAAMELGTHQWNSFETH